MGLLERYGWEFVGPLGWWLSLKPDEQAAWVAAIGALAAIAVTQRIASRQQRAEVKRQRKREEIATRRYSDHVLSRMAIVEGYLQNARDLVCAARPVEIGPKGEPLVVPGGQIGALPGELIPDSDDVEYATTGAAYGLQQATRRLSAAIARHGTAEYDPSRSQVDFKINDPGTFVSECEPLLVDAEIRAAALKKRASQAIEAPWPKQ